MKIWIDLTNSPHVNFFSGMIKELQQDHDVLLTCRPLANTIGLLQLEQFPFTKIGRHYGRRKLNKIIGFMIRIVQLFWFLKDKHIDVAISHSSFYSPVVAKMLGVRSIYLNDNEHAAGNRISFLAADTIFVPEFLDREKVIRQGARQDKIFNYPGVKEGVYLWNFAAGHTGKEKSSENGKRTVYIRPEPWTAQYYQGSRNFMDQLLLDLATKYRVKLLPRGVDQVAHYHQGCFSGIQVLEKSIPLADIMDDCDCFIGAGGTMTREAAVLGIPTLSIYQDKLLDVDHYLISINSMTHTLEPTEIQVTAFMEKMKKRPPEQILVKKGRQAYALIKQTLLSDPCRQKTPPRLSPGS